MGEVFEATSPEGSRVALKLLPKGRASAVFEHEVRILARLRNPSLVSVLGFAADSRDIFGDDRGPAYWMEFVEGSKFLDAARNAGAEKILRWFREGLEALDALHTQGILHGDISPANLLIDAQDRLRLVDLSIGFGDASKLEMATLPYMAPERIDGHRIASGDLFSYATVFYEALSGRHPRLGCRSLGDFLERPADALSETASDFASEHALEARVIQRMLAIAPSDRFSGAREILKALQTGRSDRPSDFSEFHTARMIGAEEAWKTAEEALARAAEKSAVLAVHGASGTGKSRFAREVVLEARLKGLAAEVYDGWENLDPAALESFVRRLKDLPERGEILLLTWSDDSLSPFARRFLGNVLNENRDDRVVSVALRALNREETEQLAAAAFGSEAAREAAELLFEDTGGNPQKLVQRIRLMAEKSLVREGRLSGDWKARLRDVFLAERPLDDRAIPASLVHAIGAGDGDTVALLTRDVAEALRNERKPAQGLDLIARALPLVSDPAERSRLMRFRINFLNDLGRYADALSACDEWFHAPGALEAGDEPAAVKTVKYWLVTGQASQNLGDKADAVRRLKACVAAGESAGGGDAEVRPYLLKALSLLGLEALERGDFAEARDCFWKVIERAGASPLKAEALRHLATVVSREGDWEGAKAHLGDALKLYESAGHLEGRYWTRLHEGNLAVDHQRFDEAASAYAQAGALAREAGLEMREAIVWNNLGVLERKRGRFVPARDLLLRAGEVLGSLGSGEYWAQNRKEIALVEAGLGRFAAADAAVHELETLLASEGRGKEGFDKLLREAVQGVSEVRDGSDSLPPRVLEEIFKDLPPEFQVTFVERGDWKKKEASPKLKTEKTQGDPMTTPFLPVLTELNQALLIEEDIPKVLGRLMDSAMTIAGAENGFLVLRSEDPNGLIPGFEIAVARNVAKEDLSTDLYSFSLSAVRRALQSGEPVVTDNAMIDPNFREAKSVQLHQLKSILALPVRGAGASGEILGVFYLDHRFQKGLFEGEMLEVMKAFAGVAALALQKGKMIEGLKKRNSEMEVKIGEQEGEVHQLQREVNRSRMILKKEYGDIVGRSPKMMEVLSVVDRITDAKVPVWIYGESGTGKEAIARALHFNSTRAKKPFVTENCSALPESLLESELFGHKKGAFTHAVTDKKGLLQFADGGTIFLDEIADMSLNLQAKLLRFLQEGEVRPIGAQEPVRVDARVVSASNKDLKSLVADGKFREDLFYRLNGITVKLPPLRERLEDLPLLAEHFLKKIAERAGGKPCKLDAGVLRIFLQYSWPGNIRELQNTLETAVLFAEKNAVTRDSLSFKPALFEVTPSSKTSSSAVAASAGSAGGGGLPPIVMETLKALRDQCYHKGKAAKALGISRRSLYARLERAGIDPNASTLKEMIEKSLA